MMDLHHDTKVDINNIVGSLWQSRRENSGSNDGNKDQGDDNDMATDLRLFKQQFPLQALKNITGVDHFSDINKEKPQLTPTMFSPLSSPQGLLKSPSSTGFSHHSLISSQPLQSSPGPPSLDFSNQQNWSFEEQFKQLYEIDANPERKKFLDDLFDFMQKRGTPISRLPIMAKQVLDLYELYNLVVARGGLVEVINKKLWQEIIKGLGLPSSITSAAFTLRTQYTKYLYPMECKLRNLSSPSDLQSAIEGNKREGRTNSYGPFGGMSPLPFQNPPLHPSIHSMPPFPLINPSQRPPMYLNGNPPNFPLGPLPSPFLPRSPTNPINNFERTRLALLKMYNQNIEISLDKTRPPIPIENKLFSPTMPGQNHNDTIKFQSELKEEGRTHMNIERLGERLENNGNLQNNPIRRDTEDDGTNKQTEADDTETQARKISWEDENMELNEENDQPISLSTNIKVTSRGEDPESSLIVSLDLNGLSYQGILFQEST